MSGVFFYLFFGALAIALAFAWTRPVANKTDSGATNTPGSRSVPGRPLIWGPP